MGTKYSDIEVNIYLDLHVHINHCNYYNEYITISRCNSSLIPIIHGKGEAKSEAYLKISPGGRVPVMREGDWVLTET